MSNISTENQIAVTASSIKAGTPIVSVNGMYMPALPKTMTSIDANISNAWNGVNESSILPGTPCMQLSDGKIIPLMSSKNLATKPSGQFVMFHISGLGWFKQEGYTFHNPDDWYDHFEYTIWEHSGWIIHPFKEYKQEDGYMYLIDTNTYGHPEYPLDPNISVAFKCPKSDYNKIGTVWEVMPNSTSIYPSEKVIVTDRYFI